MRRAVAASLVALSLIPVVAFATRANASSVGDYVDYGRMTKFSCLPSSCDVSLRNQATGQTVHTWPTMEARIYGCGEAGIATFALVNKSNLDKLLYAQSDLSIIWSARSTVTGVPTKVGSVTCK